MLYIQQVNYVEWDIEKYRVFNPLPPEFFFFSLFFGT